MSCPEDTNLNCPDCHSHIGEGYQYGEKCDSCWSPFKAADKLFEKADKMFEEAGMPYINMDQIFDDTFKDIFGNK